MKPVKTDVNFPQLESQTLDFWKKNGIIEKGLKAHQGKERFVFYDGPPFATGTPHYGHILAGTLKDIVPRYWVMKGKYVERRWGWDCHGLPVEYEMEKELGIKGKHDIEKMGVAEFNESCRSIVLRYTKEWENIIVRTGRWADFENGYRTMDADFMESVWWVCKSLWDKGLIFEGHRVMPYSWRISTPLSNFEANLNYKEVQDPALTVKLKADDGENRHFLIWTTTPWTLPSNLAIAVHPEIDYVEVKDNETGEHLILAKARIGAYFKQEEQYSVVKEMKGTQLEHRGYTPLFPYFADQKQSGAFKVVLGDYVTTEDGTGLVHQAPAFGEDDMKVCQKYGIPLVDPIDDEGRFDSQVPEYEGQNVKEADKLIIKDLKAQNKVYRHETIDHNYPFCWRSDTPLIYKAISTWFVKLGPLKEKLIAANQNTHWVPEHLRDGRFGKWLEGARDWNISRNRYWGTPIPIWRCGDCEEMRCIGSRQELTELSGESPQDLHKHFVDQIEIGCENCGSKMNRIPEVLDCWFESGSMPYGQAHYPFENKEAFEANFPADFIAEGLDQTRGWFYTLSVLGTALFGQAPFKNVIVNGLILAEDGKKMSKSLKNYPPPEKVLDSYGADALRAYLSASPASHAEELRFSETGVKEIVRSVLLPYWNAYSFFVTYALADGWTPDKFNPQTLNTLENDLDRWVLSKLQSLIKDVDEKMKEYHLYEVVPIILGFIDELTNWYIRLNRRRFWKEDKGADKDQAYTTLYFVLTSFSKLLAPLMPFATEAVYQNLEAGDDKPESIHLCLIPEAESKWIDSELESRMELVERVVEMGRNLRSVHKIKTRQPLRKVTIVAKDSQGVDRYNALIRTELNVKEIAYDTDESAYVDFTAKPNAKILGKKLGKKMKEVSAAIRALTSQDLAQLESTGSLTVAGETLAPEEILIDRKPKAGGVVQTDRGLTVILDTDLDNELVAEGQAREFVNRVQKLRKDLDFQVTDRINVQFQCPEALQAAILKHQDYICAETLTRRFEAIDGGDHWTSEQKIDAFSLKLRVERASD